MPADKVKFKQIANEIIAERQAIALQEVQKYLDKEEWDNAEREFALLLQDLKRVRLAKEVSDK